jgi:hypothetical protein
VANINTLFPSFAAFSGRSGAADSSLRVRWQEISQDWPEKKPGLSRTPFLVHVAESGYPPRILPRLSIEAIKPFLLSNGEQVSAITPV